MCGAPGGRRTGSPTASPSLPFPLLPPPEYPKLASFGGGGGRRGDGAQAGGGRTVPQSSGREVRATLASPRPERPPPFHFHPQPADSSPRGNNRDTMMPGADEAFLAEPRTTLVFGAVTSKSEPLTFQESLRFVKKVKARNYMLYLSLFDILGRTELSQLEAYQTLQLLFRDHPDLHEGLKKFRPPVHAKHAPANGSLWPWVLACAAVPLVAMSLIPALGNPVLWLVQQTLGEKMRVA